MLRILYEDNHIIAVYKPAGTLVQKDKSGKDSLMDEVRKYLKDKYKKPGNVFLGLVHRLDRNVSGIVLFGKTSKGASRLSEQFRNNQIVKIYHAVVEGETSKKGELAHFLKKDLEQFKALVSNSDDGGYDRSELSYETIKTNKNFSLVKIRLETGRFHQIRAQFSVIGHPIAGDSKYGAKSSLRDRSLALCATEIGFRTPTTQKLVNLKINYPRSWIDFLENKTGS